MTTNTWAGGPAMVAPNATRHEHTATLLANGNVVVIGGLSGTAVLNNAEIYNPTGTSFGTWTAVANTMTSPRRGHTATLLAVPGNSTLNNQVLVVGGNNGGSTNVSVNTAQVFNGTTTWTAAGTLAATRESHTATALANGNVLIAGGKTVASGGGTTFPQTTQVFNAASGAGSWNSTSASGSTVSRRIGHTATLLPTGCRQRRQGDTAGGRVVRRVDTLDTVEVWDGATSWTPAPSLSTSVPTALTAVKGHAATLLGTNNVLIVGGVNGTTPISNAGRYDVSFGVACTTNSQCATDFVSTMSAANQRATVAVACAIRRAVSVCAGRVRTTFSVARRRRARPATSPRSATGRR